MRSDVVRSAITRSAGPWRTTAWVTNPLAEARAAATVPTMPTPEPGSSRIANGTRARCEPCSITAAISGAGDPSPIGGVHRHDPRPTERRRKSWWPRCRSHNEGWPVRARSTISGRSGCSPRIRSDSTPAADSSCIRNRSRSDRSPAAAARLRRLWPLRSSAHWATSISGPTRANTAIIGLTSVAMAAPMAIGASSAAQPILGRGTPGEGALGSGIGRWGTGRRWPRRTAKRAAAGLAVSRR